MDNFNASTPPYAGDPTSFASTPELRGQRVTLVPLSQDHAPQLAKACDGIDLWLTTVPTPQGVPADIDRRLGLQARGESAPWAVLDNGVPIGMTSYLHIDATNRRLEIGSTWLHAAARGTRVNPEAKLLLLTRAFEELDVIAVEFRTHHLNSQSRAAIAKLGAKQDGILRNHQLFNGVLRDTVCFSIIRSEWPTVKRALQERLKTLP